MKAVVRIGTPLDRRVIMPSHIDQGAKYRSERRILKREKQIAVVPPKENK